MKSFADYAKIRETLTWTDVLGQVKYISQMDDQYLINVAGFLEKKINNPATKPSYKVHLKHRLGLIKQEIKYRRYIENTPVAKVLYGRKAI